MVPDDGDSAVARSPRDKARSSTPKKGCFALCKTVSHWAVEKFGWLYSNTLDVRRFAVMLCGGRKFTTFDCLVVCRDTGTGAWS